MARLAHTFRHSSRIRRGWYSPETKTVELEFPDGAHAVYRNVPRSVWDGLVGAESPGRYLAEILERYPFRSR